MATASLTEEQLPEVLQCPICLETIIRAKVLPCGHTYCASCLQSHIISKVINKGINQTCFSCPVCRANTQLSDPTLSVEQWAESFPANSIVSAIFDLTGEMHGDNVCDTCQKWNIQTAAVSFCKDCKRFMCKICREHHNENHSQLRHDVIDLISENTSCLAIPNLSMIEMCQRHLKKSIEFFCRDHDSLCCSTCGFLEHRKCERVITIEDFIKHFNVRAKSKDMEANLRNIKSHMTQMTRKVNENVEGIKNEKSAILQQIRSLRAEINFQVQKREDDLISSLEVNYKTEFLKLQSQEASGHSLMTAVESDLTQKYLVMTHGSETQKVIMLHNMEQNQNRYHKVMSEYKDELRNIKVSLYINKRLKDLIKELNGSITVTRTKQVFPSCIIVTPSQPNAEVVSGSNGIPLKNRRAVKVSEFNVKVLGDSAICHISDVLTLQGAKHILVDRSNSKIKIYAENYKFQESMTVQGNPWNACILPDNNIAVTVPNNKTILIIGIADKIQNIRNIRTRLSCWGIAVFKKRFIIITCHDEDSILILDMSGAEVRTLRPDNYIGYKLICPWYLKVKESETVIYVSYSFGHKMVAYNRLWNRRFTYTDQNMKLPDGIDTDREGNIYLCGYDSYNVQQISADGELIKTLISKEDDKLKPRTLRFYRDLDRFVVTYCNCDIVEVYDMCD